MALCIQSSLEELPDEIIIRILSYLSPIDLYHVYEIPNRRIKSLAVDKALLRNLNFARCYNEDRTTIEKIIKEFRKYDSTTSLSLENCYQVKVSKVVTSLVGFTRLQVLDLTFVYINHNSLAKLLDGLMSLEALGVTGDNFVLVNSDTMKPLRPFSKHTMEAVKRLKHLKIMLGYDGVKMNTLLCFQNIETLMLDFMPSLREDFDHCICGFETLMEEDFRDFDKLQVIFSSTKGLKTSGIRCWNHFISSFHHQSFKAVTWKTKQAMCFEHYNIIEAGFSEHGSYEAKWTALIRNYSKEVGLSQTPSSPFFRLPSEDDVMPAADDIDKQEMITSDVKAVKAMRLCCISVEEKLSALLRVSKYTHLEELDVFCLADDIVLDAAAANWNYSASSENVDESSERFEGLLQLIERAPKLWRLSLTVPVIKVTMRKFLADLSARCKQFQSFSLTFPRDWPQLQLSPHLSAALPHMTQLRDLRLDSSHFYFNPHFAWSLQKCPFLTRLCILTKSGSCSACHSWPAIFNSCKNLIFVCLDGFTHNPCSKKRAHEVKVSIKDRYRASRPGLYITLSLEDEQSMPVVHLFEMVKNHWSQRP